MRAEALSWDDWSAVNEPAVNDDDKWHVQLAPDDVKVVTLEQLDDLFRLSIVDAETKVWQTGMSEWLPLGVIADLDEKPPAEPKRSHPKPPSPEAARAQSAPPRAQSAPPRAQSAPPRAQSAPPRPQSAPPRAQSAPPRAQSAPPRPQSAPPRPQSAPPRPQSAPPRAQSAPPPAAARPQSVPQRSVPHAPSHPPAAPGSFYPHAVAPTPAPLAFAAPTAAMTPAFAQPSVRPLVVSHAPPRRPARAGVGRLLIGVALIAGVAISLYRNGLVHDAALAVHQEALYDRLEAALGGPAFGTLRALEQSAAAPFAASSAAERIGTSRPLAAAAPAAAAPAVEAPQTAPGTAPPVVSLESLAREKKALTPGPKAEAPLPAKSAPASKAPPAEKPQPVSQKPEAAMTERERLNAAIGQAMSKAPAASKAGAKSKASEYDPLNPKL
jgi:hypothetical protein